MCDLTLGEFGGHLCKQIIILSLGTEKGNINAK
jgi:hypothetical protein